MTWKQILKAPLRPLVRPLLDRLEAGSRAQLAELAGTITALGAEVADLDRSVTADLDELAKRFEFVRKEMLFELRYGKREVKVEGSDHEIEPRILNAKKWEAMAQAIRLNLGAGHVTNDGYLNVDARELPDIDVLADVGNLPVEKGSVAEIYAAHLLEHFPVEELRSVLLPYWVSLLREGGEFVAVVPDMETMIREYAAGRMSFEELREVTYGTQEYEGDFHFNGFSQESLRALFESAGLGETSVRVAARRNGMCYEMEIVGVRASAPSPE
jgi:hypothetical protein